MSSISATQQAQITISLGGVVVSNYLSYLTMGIVLCATWSYFSQFPDDRWRFKALVILCVSMCIGDTIATGRRPRSRNLGSPDICALTGMWTYDWAVENYANPAALTFTHWAIPAEGFLFGSCGLTGQLFYAWRVWMMSMRKNWILPGVIACLSISSWCLICWIVYTSATHKLISDLTLFQTEVYIWWGGSVGADVLITSSMIYYLDLRFRLERHSMQLDHRLSERFRRLIVRTVECNLLTLLAQAIGVGLFGHRSVGLYYFITDMTLTKVSTFSLLVSLNCRHSHNGHGTSEGDLQEETLS
ncbi:hypothetical protein BT96DRAFT_999956 [Gymnopus androsaceus JB14]|uniref:DUF6534 domain-containing protein n=1 Tax=Gymnopus androsaceus JB14 TaxID=1447944 RepID=A0A6A4H6V2_9AGAR|nr:hypothetical protein BT96DRAFT_999956 [Gymnopus androsaceus JB14]